jgi:hypothetical protein
MIILYNAPVKTVPLLKLKALISMKYIPILASLLLFVQVLKAQQLETDTLGTVLFTADSRFDKAKLIPSAGSGKSSGRVVKKDSKGNYLPVLVNGYRLQVLTTTDRALADAMKAKLYNLFPGQSAYKTAKPPYYSVQQGNYLTMEEAKRARAYAAKALGQAVYIINVKILALPPEAAIKTTTNSK